MTRSKRSRTRGRLLWILALIVPGLALVYGWGPGGWFSRNAKDLLEGALVRRGPLAITVTERGNLEAKNKYSLKNEVEGRTTVLSLIEEGTHVQAGDIVAELDATALVDQKVQQEDDVLNARATLAKAKANLEIQKTENESLIARAEQTVAFAVSDLSKYIEGDWPQKLKEADEGVLLAEEELKSAQDQFDWSKKLEESGFLTRTELERDELSFDRAKIMLEQRQRAKQLMIQYEDPKSRAKLQGDLDEARRELKKVQLQADAQIVDQETAVLTADARLKIEEKEYAKLEDQIQKAVMRAPVDGMVVYGREDGGRWGGGEPVQEGGEVRERQEIVSIPSSGDMMAQASIHESVLKQVEVGQEVIVRVDAIPAHEFRGRVDFVAMLPDKNSWWANPNLRVYKTEVSIADETDQMRPGMSCNVEILVDQLEDTLYVPLQAVVHQHGKNLGFVRAGPGIEQREVEIGPHNEKWVAIQSGLSEGEVVLLSPPPGFEAATGLDEEEKPGEQAGQALPVAEGGRASAPAAEHGPAGGARLEGGGEGHRGDAGSGESGRPGGRDPGALQHKEGGTPAAENGDGGGAGRHGGEREGREGRGPRPESGGSEEAQKTSDGAQQKKSDGQ